MTFRIRTIGIYRCDTPGCPERRKGHLEGLPEGWEALTVVGHPTGNQDRLEHRCPACIEKVRQATALAPASDQVVTSHT